MDAEYEFIVFRLLERKAKKSIWACLNKNSETPLGEVRWYGAWRQYCYFPTTQAIYSAGCLADIKNFIGRIMKLHKQPAPTEGE